MLEVGRVRIEKGLVGGFFFSFLCCVVDGVGGRELASLSRSTLNPSDLSLE